MATLGIVQFDYSNDSVIHSKSIAFPQKNAWYFMCNLLRLVNISLYRPFENILLSYTSSGFAIVLVMFGVNPGLILLK